MLPLRVSEDTRMNNKLFDFHVPKHQLPKGSMDNRGQMGIYWASLSVEIE